MNIIVTSLLLIFTMTLILAVHGWTINNNPTAVILPPPSSRYCSTINNNNAVDVPVRQQHQQQRSQQCQSRLFVLSAISASTSTDTDPTEVDCDQQQQQQDGEYDYEECIIDEDMLLFDCADLKSFIGSARSTATATVPDTEHTTTATTATDYSIMDTIYAQLHDDKGKSLLSTIIIPNTDDYYQLLFPIISLYLLLFLFHPVVVPFFFARCRLLALTAAAAFSACFFANLVVLP